MITIPLEGFFDVAPFLIAIVIGFYLRHGHRRWKEELKNNEVAMKKYVADLRNKKQDRRDEFLNRYAQICDGLLDSTPYFEYCCGNCERGRQAERWLGEFEERIKQIRFDHKYA